MRARATATVFAVALGARMIVALWAGARFPPTGDGAYYDVLARRLAQGHGYTWLWPDGVVTYASHYPVGYPALLAIVYGLFGASALAASTLNALVGAAGAAAAHRFALRSTSPRHALAAGLVVALHPALVLYTSAEMTEGVTAAILVIAAALTAAAADGAATRISRVAVGVLVGVATLVRPQCLLLAPVLGALSFRVPGAGLGLRRRAACAALVTGLAVLTCAPWTIRNCVRMERCALVSVNGGWNLLIGAETATGGWSEVVVPTPCREVWSEAAKDACFGRAAREDILRHSARWIARVPSKLAMTFDYIGAAPWYLHASNPEAFGDRAKLLHGAVETAATRILLVLALVAGARLPGPRRRLRASLSVFGAACALLTVHAWVAYLALAAAVVARGRANLEGPLLAPVTAAVILATATTHAIFFGAGRYGLPVLPFVAALGVSLGAELRVGALRA